MKSIGYFRMEAKAIIWKHLPYHRFTVADILQKCCSPLNRIEELFSYCALMNLSQLLLKYFNAIRKCNDFNEMIKESSHRSGMKSNLPCINIINVLMSGRWDRLSYVWSIIEISNRLDIVSNLAWYLPRIHSEEPLREQKRLWMQSCDPDGCKLAPKVS